jgi:hypothetical protein
VELLQGRRVELEVHLDKKVVVEAEKDLDVAFVAAFLEEDRKDLVVVVVEEPHTMPYERIHNSAHRVDSKEDVGIDQDQMEEFALKRVLVKVEVHTGLV